LCPKFQCHYSGINTKNPCQSYSSILVKETHRIESKRKKEHKFHLMINVRAHGCLGAQLSLTKTYLLREREREREREVIFIVKAL
jgi:hypothetical protein